jgi:hypothetical protein
MKYVAICLTFMVFTFFTSALADKNNSDFVQDSVLDEKTVLCEIDFRPDSYKLTMQAKKLLDDVLKQLERVDTETKIIRIEGFFDGQDTVADKTQLSMLRALAIESYFRLNHDASFERFLTGHNMSNSNCRAQIAIYNNPWQGFTDPVHVTDRKMIDGPS